MSSFKRPGGQHSLLDQIPVAGVAALVLFLLIRTVSPFAALWLILGTLVVVVGCAAITTTGRRRGR